MSNQSGGSRTDVGSWILTLIMLWVFFPVGLILLVINLKKAFQAPPPSAPPMRRTTPQGQPMRQNAQPMRQTAQPSQSSQAGQWTPVQPVRRPQHDPEPPMPPRPELVRRPSHRKKASGTGSDAQGAQRKKRRSARGDTDMRSVNLLRIGGICLIVAGVVGMSEPLGWMVRLGFDPYDLWEFLRWLAFAACGAALILVGEHRRRRAERFADYAAVIGDSQLLSLDFVASATGRPYDRVTDDLQDMIRLGWFGDESYLDLAERYFVACHAAAPRRDIRREQTTAAADDKTGRYPEEDQIRSINALVRDEHVTACMTRLEELTHKIFAYVEAHPEKESRIRRFRAHYLPKTIKICESYARFEQQGVQGENIRSAMQEVEDVMDSLVRGFENQLDMLFDDEALDVSTDISVLESMMAPTELKIGDFMPQKDEQS